MIKIEHASYLETDQIAAGYDLTKYAVTFSVDTVEERGRILNAYAEAWDGCKVYRVVDEIDDDMYEDGAGFLYITVVIEHEDTDFIRNIATDIQRRGWID